MKCLYYSYHIFTVYLYNQCLHDLNSIKYKDKDKINLFNNKRATLPNFIDLNHLLSEEHEPISFYVSLLNNLKNAIADFNALHTRAEDQQINEINAEIVLF